MAKSLKSISAVVALLLLPLLLSACDAFGLSCGATGYKAQQYFTDPDMLAVAEEINCDRVPSGELIEAVKPKINDEANENMTLLWWAYHAKDPASFEALIRAGADATIPLHREERSEQLTPIKAIMSETERNPAYLQMFEIWLQNGGDPNFTAHKTTIETDKQEVLDGGVMHQTSRPSLLETTAVHGLTGAARLLLQYGADPNQKTADDSRFPLERALAHFNVFKLIYEAGGDWERAWRDDRIADRDNVPMAYANICGYVYDNSPQKDRDSYHQVIQFLYDKGHELPPLCLERINKLGLDCKATGYEAARYFTDPDMLAEAKEINCGRTPARDLLETVKSRINEETDSHMTLLWWAYLARNPDAFEALLAAGGDATRPFNLDNDLQIKTPILAILVNSERHPSYLQMLEAYLNQGGDPDFAASEVMLAADRRVHVENERFFRPIVRPTLLGLAAETGLADAARLLLSRGADPNGRSKTDPQFPLEKAVWHFPVFELIYEAGGDWELALDRSGLDEESQIPDLYFLICGDNYANSPQQTPGSFRDVMRFLYDNGHKLPQLCLDRIEMEGERDT